MSEAGEGEETNARTKQIPRTSQISLQNVIVMGAGKPELDMLMVLLPKEWLIELMPSNTNSSANRELVGYFFWPCCAPCGVLVPRPRIKHMPSTL